MQNDVYTINATAKLPTPGDRIGKGGNAPVYLCYVTTPNGKTLIFACKVEQKVGVYIVQSHHNICHSYVQLQKPLYKNSSMFEKVCKLADSEHFVIVHAYLIGNSYNIM